MTEYTVRILQSAWDDLAMIAEYYKIKFDIDSAKKVTDQILDDTDGLSDYPERCSYINDDYLRDRGYRKLILGKFIIIFRIIEETVFVYHIAHMNTDYPKLF